MTNSTPNNLLELLRPSGIPVGLLVLMTTVIVERLLTRTLDRLGERFTDRRMAINQIGAFIRFLVYLIGGLGFLASVLILTKEIWFAVGGTVAVSIGFALKDVMASIVAGLVILMDRPFQVGDRVSFDGYYGEIRQIGLRSVRLVTLDDSHVTIPNSRFLTDAVVSGNAGAVEMMVCMDFYVGTDQDIAAAKQVVSEALTSSRFVSLNQSWVVLVNQLIHENYFAVRLRAKAYVLDVRFEKAFETDVTERVLMGFRELGVAPPAVLHRGRPG